MNRKFFIVDRNLNTTYSPIEKEGNFCVPMEAIKEMKKHCSYDEAIAYILNISIQNQEQEERIKEAIKYIEGHKIICETNTTRTGSWELLKILKGNSN